MCLDYFYNVIYSIFDECVPRKKPSRVRSEYSYPEWFNADIIHKIKRKALLHKQYKKSKSVKAYKEFSDCRAEVKKAISLALNSYRDRLQANLIDDPKSFWKFVNSSRKDRKSIGLRKNGEELTAEQSVNEFASFFESVYSPKKPKLSLQDAITGAGVGNEAARIEIPQLKLNKDKIKTWSENNKLQINLSKSYVITFTKAKAPIRYEYKLAGAPLERVQSVRDLGVTVDARYTLETT
ncbi:unnamed protein product [Leptosia nina]|uniref:Uncharacterized protein n=1 Tax=Leptosia nina TaxID=320188 RepID=A0AAV1JF56_9NEOP